MKLLSNWLGLIAYNCGVVPENPTSKSFNAVRKLQFLTLLQHSGIKSSIEIWIIIHTGQNQEVCQQTCEKTWAMQLLSNLTW